MLFLIAPMCNDLLLKNNHLPFLLHCHQKLMFPAYLHLIHNFNYLLCSQLLKKVQDKFYQLPTPGCTAYMYYIVYSNRRFKKILHQQASNKKNAESSLSRRIDFC